MICELLVVLTVDCCSLWWFSCCCLFCLFWCCWVVVVMCWTLRLLRCVRCCFTCLIVWVVGCLLDCGLIIMTIRGMIVWVDCLLFELVVGLYLLLVFVDVVWLVRFVLLFYLCCVRCLCLLDLVNSWMICACSLGFMFRCLLLVFMIACDCAFWLCCVYVWLLVVGCLTLLWELLVICLFLMLCCVIDCLDWNDWFYLCVLWVCVYVVVWRWFVVWGIWVGCDFVRVFDIGSAMVF